jgi:sensor domain CHASE-containing protein
MPHRPRRRARTTLVAIGLAAAAGLARAWRADRWYDRALRERERANVSAVAADVARTIERELSRRVLLLTGLRAFAESHAGDRDRLERDLPVFATGLLAGVDGVRALQFVHEGRITATWPVAGNEAVLGYDLYAHPDPRVAADVRRAVVAGGVVITGPLELVQGGAGLLTRLAVGGPAGRNPELVNIIIDVPTLLDDAGLAAGASGRT